MHYMNTLRNFELQWNSLEEKIAADEPEVPKITKNTQITRWSESFIDFLQQCYGVRKAPLAYVVRKEVLVTPGPPLPTNQPYSTEHGSVEEELVTYTKAMVTTHDNKKPHHNNQQMKCTNTIVPIVAH